MVESQWNLFYQNGTLLSNYVSVIARVNTHGQNHLVSRAIIALAVRIMGTVLPVIAVISAMQETIVLVLKVSLQLIGHSKQNISEQFQLTLRSIVSIFISLIAVPWGLWNTGIYKTPSITSSNIIKVPSSFGDFDEMITFLESLNPKKKIIELPDRIPFSTDSQNIERQLTLNSEGHKLTFSMYESLPKKESLTNHPELIYRAYGLSGITISSTTLTDEDLLKYIPNLLQKMPYITYLTFEKCSKVTIKGINQALNEAKKMLPYSRLQFLVLGYQEQPKLDTETFNSLETLVSAHDEIVLFDFRNTDYTNGEEYKERINAIIAQKKLYISPSGYCRFNEFQQALNGLFGQLSSCQNISDYFRSLDNAFSKDSIHRLKPPEEYASLKAIAVFMLQIFCRNLTIQKGEMSSLVQKVFLYFPSIQIWDFCGSTFDLSELEWLKVYQPKKLRVTLQDEASFEIWKDAIDPLLPYLEKVEFYQKNDALSNPPTYIGITNNKEKGIQDQLNAYITQKREEATIKVIR